MCILQASLNVTLRLFANSAQHSANLTSEEDRLQASLRSLTEEKAQLQLKYEQLLKELDQSYTETQICNNNLQRKAETATSLISHLTPEKVQLQTRNEQLQKELDQTRAQLQNYKNSLQRKAEIVEKTCPAGWRRRGSRMYFISKGTNSWSQSREDCRERGSDLVIINSSDEQRFIQALGMQVWIGLSEISSRWTWVDGSSLNSGYWRTGEPNEYRSGEDCAESKPDDDFLNTWNDERCHVSLNWVCEREAC
ncbi:CD209 antigen-like protein C [Astyanax mexicanus]|uniref:CD209 antigen-like protein C n=1 Tax=Astyanax mexicanus TaxID=7994 RepID=UPI0020CAEF12|nr:CD209 antigen-like protein C [Astyanax mexicanus]